MSRASRLSSSVFLAFALMASALPAVAQTSDPGTVETDGADVVLPDMDSEVRGVQPRDVDAPLPPAPVLPLPASGPPLPPEAQLSIPESAYRTEATLDTSARAALGETFTEASVGAGLWDGVSAALSIYRPGADPSFSMTFAHDSTDGFAFRERGEGFYERRTALSGRVRGTLAGSSAWSLSASFADEADGLQGQSVDFYGVSHRYLDVLGSYTRPLGPLDLRVEMDAASASRDLELAVENPAGSLGTNELILSPRVALEFERDIFYFSLESDYRFLGLLGLGPDDEPKDRATQRISADLVFRADVSSLLSLGAMLGVVSSSSSPLLVPFALSLEAGLGPYVSLALDGGLAFDDGSLGEEWRDDPWLDVGGIPADDGRWNANARIDLFPFPDLTARVGAAWALSLPGSGRLVPELPAGATQIARGLNTYRVEEYSTLESEFALRWLIGGSASIGIGWKADWFDPPVSGDVQRLSLEAEYRGRDEAFGAALAASAGLSSETFSAESLLGGSDTPKVDFNGFVRLSPEIRLIADFRDILIAFAGPDGRPGFGLLLENGFQASVKLQISL